jgi:hypothetical protein
MGFSIFAAEQKLRESCDVAILPLVYLPYPISRHKIVLKASNGAVIKGADASKRGSHPPSAKLLAQKQILPSHVDDHSYLPLPNSSVPVHQEFQSSQITTVRSVYEFVLASYLEGGAKTEYWRGILKHVGGVSADTEK